MAHTMYHFAIVALLGLAAYKVVGLLLSAIGSDESSRVVRTFSTLAMGVVFTEILDYSVFASWGVTLRDAWMGPVWTGLIVGATAFIWHEVLGLIEAYGRRSRDEALEIERRSPRAA